MKNEFLTGKNQMFIERLKELKIIRPFLPEDMQRVAEEGAELLTCGDGDIDLSQHFQLAITNRSHKIMLFGGTLCVVPQYRGYDREDERVIIKNIAEGFSAKKPGKAKLFLGHHVICGMAVKYGHTVERTVYFNYLANKRFCNDLIGDINVRLPEELWLREDRIYNLFHTKKINENGSLEQNTYIFCPDLYEEYFI